MKRCACNTLFNHPTEDTCATCGGRACGAPSCGRAKQPHQTTCGRALCKRWYTRTQAQAQRDTAAAAATAAAERTQRKVVTPSQWKRDAR